MAALWALFVIALSMPNGRAQLGDSEFLPPKEAFQVSATAEGADKIRVDFLIAPAYYLYRHRFSFAIDADATSPGAALGNAAIPEGEWKEDEFFGRQQVYYSAVSVTVPVSRAPGEALTLPLVIGLQGCADAGLCYPPEKRRLSVTLPATDRAATLPADSGGFVSEQDRLAAVAHCHGR